ncbi:hypothetical protein CTI12_AA139740 [Artemisia annua]|uniref:C2H2-type domain-containing protein n=1 Tax=Artemisia annua TaxID=35608 RepID=A0A2U1PLD2_ARTAN|nr:hypothetical protein CTI12_AA139740 [Artemisia annua]
MKYNLKNNAQKIRDQLLENPKPNNVVSVHGSTAHRPDQPSLSTSIVASSIQPVHQLSTVTTLIQAWQLRARHVAPTNQTPVSLPNFFSTHRLKRTNVTNSFDKVTYKRRKSAENTNERSNAIAAKPVIEGYLHSTSDAGESTHISNKSCFKPAWENTKPATDVTTRPAQTCFSPSGLQIHCHATEGTSDTNTYLPPNVPTSDDRAPDNNSSFLTNAREKRPTSRIAAYTGSSVHNSGQQSNLHCSFLTNAQEKRPTSRIAADTGSNVHNSGQQSNLHQSEDESPVYEDLGDCNERCRYCNAAFWHEERLKGHREAKYHLCCGGGKIYMESDPDPPEIACDKCAENDVPEFKVRLYNGNGARGYELPTSQAIGAIVFDGGPMTEIDYDIIIEYRDGPAKRINKLHQSYMSLQFPLIFIYGQPGYHIKLMTRLVDPNERMRRSRLILQQQKSQEPDQATSARRPKVDLLNVNI